MRVTQTLHGVRPSAATNKINGILPKLQRVLRLADSEGLSAMALQECPGLTADPTLEVLKQFLEALTGPAALAHTSVRWAAAA